MIVLVTVPVQHSAVEVFSLLFIVVIIIVVVHMKNFALLANIVWNIFASLFFTVSSLPSLNDAPLATVRQMRDQLQTERLRIVENRQKYDEQKKNNDDGEDDDDDDEGDDDDDDQKRPKQKTYSTMNRE